MKLNKLSLTTTVLLLIGLNINTVVSAEADSDMSIETLIEDAKEQIDELNSFYKESKTTLTTDEMTTELIVKEWMKQEDSNTLLRYEIIHDEDDVDIIVGSDDYALSYNENEAVAYEYIRSTNEEEDEASESIVNGYDDTQAVSVIEAALEQYDVTIDGTEEILDRESYHLIFEPKADADLTNTFEMWVDTEFFIILKQHEVGERHEFLLEVTDIETNEEIDDGMFELDIPEDVETITQETGEVS
ncbi:LolA family protein [Aliicoccus persicus]|uniref:Outer membrane lipoprotein-sorting protein n=1 Tax=Aliicoccus persicus TaxID=930138 RepID=A0A662Z209_9STAP|nr:hypothetical protein [Aliicoccus persicus]SEV82239.1 hypothetical protein SAMN05192557_0228 [Aliicoccus persicus]